MHRYVYYNVATFTDAQLDAMMSLLQKQESETAELQGITIREAEKRDSFDCSFVVMTVWRLLGDGQPVGREQALFLLEDEDEPREPASGPGLGDRVSRRVERWRVCI